MYAKVYLYGHTPTVRPIQGCAPTTTKVVFQNGTVVGARMKLSGKQVYEAVHHAVRTAGSLKEPFTPLDVRRVCPGWAYPRYFAFLADHCNDNQSVDSALFIRVGRGLYRLPDREPFLPAALPAGLSRTTD